MTEYSLKIRFMKLIHRIITQNIQHALNRHKSVLLIGPRQTGKRTVVENQIKPDISYSFAKLQSLQRYEKNPTLLERELSDTNIKY